MILYFLFFLSIPFFYYFLKNKKFFIILKNDPFLLYRIIRDTLYYYKKKFQKTCISEARVVGKFYEVDYTYNGTIYTKRFHKVVEPSTLNIIKIYTIVNENEIEVTDKLLPYIGVNKDFHSATPSILGYENLHFITEDILEETTNIITIEKNTPIKL